MRIAILFTRSKLRPAANDAVASKLVTSKAHERWKMLESAKPQVLTWYGNFVLFCDMDHLTASYQHSDIYCLPVLVMCVVPGK